MVGISGTQAIVILSATAHPASSIAGRASNVPVHVLLDRPAEHSIRHGQASAEHCLGGLFLGVGVCAVRLACCQRKAQSQPIPLPVQELALQRFREISVAAGVGKNIKKRLRSDDIPLIEGPTVDSKSVMELTDFAATDSSVMTGEIFGGLDSVNEDLEHKVPRQVQGDLERYQLSLTTSPEGRGLVTRRPLKEGDEVCACPCIFLTSTAKLTAFLSKPAHACLATTIVRLKNVPLYGQTQDLFCVLTGAARRASGGLQTSSWCLTPCQDVFQLSLIHLRMVLRRLLPLPLSTKLLVERVLSASYVALSDMPVVL